jgi:hypothetical protein
MLVDTQRQAVEVYRHQEDTLWILHPFGPRNQEELSSLSLSFPIEALYKNVALPEDTPEAHRCKQLEHQKRLPVCALSCCLHILRLILSPMRIVRK